METKTSKSFFQLSGIFLIGFIISVLAGIYLRFTTQDDYFCLPWNCSPQVQDCMIVSGILGLLMLITFWFGQIWIKIENKHD